MSRHPLIHIHGSMMQRCNNPKNPAYKDYGARGIKVCEEWRRGIDFLNWALLNGWHSGLEIDRRDNSLGYSPDNCHFVTRIVNARNRRSNLSIEYKGQIKPLTVWCEICNTHYKAVFFRLKKGWSIEEALETPIGPQGPKKYKTNALI